MTLCFVIFEASTHYFGSLPTISVLELLQYYNTLV